MATTVAAYGKVKLAAQRGEQMPEGWMMDKQGKPLTDPQRSSEGSLLPIGDYKGYGLALMVSLLAGSLNGAAAGKETIDFNAHHDLITNTGQVVIAVDPSAFGDVDLFLERVLQLVLLNVLKRAFRSPLNCLPVSMPALLSGVYQLWLCKGSIS